jgi:hypothetical protein
MKQKSKTQNFVVRFYADITGSLHTMNISAKGKSLKNISAAVNKEIMKNYGEPSPFRIIHVYKKELTLFS